MATRSPLERRDPDEGADEMKFLVMFAATLTSVILVVPTVAQAAVL